MSPYATDEHGEVIPDPSTPRWVVTPEQHERWAECVRIAKAVTGQQENTIEVDNFAAAVFDMPNPTHPAGSSMGPRVVQEADLSPRTRNLLQRAADRRRRDRRGRWVDGPRADGVEMPQSTQLAPGPAPRSPGTTREMIRALGLDDWPEPTPKALALLGGKRETAHRFYLPGSPGTRDAPHPTYVKDRRPIHDRAAGRLLAGLPVNFGEQPTGLAELLGVGHPIVAKLHAGGLLSDDEKEQVRVAADAARDGGPPQALFTAGGPASGKTSVLRDNRETLRPRNAVTVDPDLVKEELPEYTELRASGDDSTRRYAASAVHLESGDIAARVTKDARELGLNMVIDGTGNDEPGEYVRQLQKKRDAGYEVSVLYVNAPTEVAILDAVNRAEESGRFVPIPRIRELHAKVSERFDEVAGLEWLKRLDVFERQEHIATGGSFVPPDAEDRRVLAFDKARLKAFVNKRAETWERRREVRESDEQGQLIDEADLLPKGVQSASWVHEAGAAGEVDRRGRAHGKPLRERGPRAPLRARGPRGGRRRPVVGPIRFRADRASLTTRAAG